jgi:Domain of unknown function (DUF4258)
MPEKPLTFTNHAESMLSERGIERAWVEATIAAPVEKEPDPRRPGVTLAFRAVAERAGRVLRVAYDENDNEIRIITTYFDCARRRKRAAK